VIIAEKILVRERSYLRT